MATNKETYDAIFAKVFSLTPEDLAANPSMMTVDSWDSMAQMELVAQLEDQFDVMLDPMQIIELSSYDAGKAVLAANGVTIEE